MDEERLILCLVNSWNGIAADCFKALEEAGLTASMTQDEVIVQALEYAHSHGQDEEAASYLLKLDRNEQDRIGRKAFPRPRYGW